MSVTAVEIEHCRNRIYAEPNKILQDTQICHHIIPGVPKRSRSKNSNNPTKKHTISVEYIVSYFSELN